MSKALRFVLNCFLLTLSLVALAACATAAPQQEVLAAALPVPTATPKPVLCSYVITAQNAKEGNIKDWLYQILGGNGSETMYVNGSTLYTWYEEGDVISLETPVKDCEGEVNLGRQVYFTLPYGTSSELNNFKPQYRVSSEELNQFFITACMAAKFNLLNGMRYDGANLEGCNYGTAVKLSLQDGRTFCNTYATYRDAFEDTLQYLDIIMYGSVFSQAEVITPPKGVCP